MHLAGTGSPDGQKKLKALNQKDRKYKRFLKGELVPLSEEGAHPETGRRERESVCQLVKK